MDLYNGKFQITVENGLPVRYLEFGDKWHDIVPGGIIFHLYYKILALESELKSERKSQ